MTREVWCQMGGLMEDPYFHWEKFGEAEGNTPGEVYANLAAKDADFEEYYDPERQSYWGWQLEVR